MYKQENDDEERYQINNYGIFILNLKYLESPVFFELLEKEITNNNSRLKISSFILNEINSNEDENKLISVENKIKLCLDKHKMKQKQEFNILDYWIKLNQFSNKKDENYKLGETKNKAIKIKKSKSNSRQKKSKDVNIENVPYVELNSKKLSKFNSTIISSTQVSST